MEIDIEDGVSVGAVIRVEFLSSGPGPTPSDADKISLAAAILASDYIQNQSWTETPAIQFITEPSQRSLI